MLRKCKICKGSGKTYEPGISGIINLYRDFCNACKGLGKIVVSVL